MAGGLAEYAGGIEIAGTICARDPRRTSCATKIP